MISLFSPNFIVLDTEGKNTLSEIAIINHQGQLIYEAYTQTADSKPKLYSKPLAQILEDFFAIAFIPQPKIIVCHFAEHDRQILKNSCRQAGITWKELAFVCTVERSQRLFPRLANYSLAHLSKHFRLLVDNKLFNARFAHASRYDAIFTYQLYLKLQSQSAMNILTERLQTIPNPFTSSHVDNPFQHHIDLQALYHGEYERLKSILVDIKRDINHQSRGAVVIGEAGSGKTHLMMRLAKDLLKTNRLLFIRQPNNASAVMYHTYARILESFAEKIPKTEHTQLELLVANSFVNILGQSQEFVSTESGRKTLAILREDALRLYKFRAGSPQWKSIELNIVRWWERKYNAAGHSGSILKGILKFCSYVDPNLKSIVRRWLAGREIGEEETEKVNLENWSEEKISCETFALEAIAVFGRLSTLDEPLIIVFDQLEGLSNKSEILTSFGDAIKEILTVVPNSLVILNLFPDRWQQFQTVFDNAVIGRFPDQVHLPRPNANTLSDILQAKLQNTTLDLGEIFDAKEQEDILSQKSIRAVLNRAADYYRYKVSDIPLPTTPISPILPIANEPALNESRWDYVQQEIAELKQAITQIQQTLGNISLAQPLTQENINSQTKYIFQPISPKNQLLAQPSSQPDIPQHHEIREYIQRKQSQLAKDYDRPHIIFDAEDLGKLSQILESFQLAQHFTIDQMRLGKRVLPEHFQFKIKNQEYVIGFLHIGGSAFTTRIKNFNELVVSYPRTKFYLLRDVRETAITGNVGKEEIEKLRYTPNGDFQIMDKGDRINFDSIYDLIIDIKNQDLDTDIVTGIRVLTQELKDYWLIKIVTGEESI